MERMRDVLRSGLGRSLEALEPLDRLRAAWPVACGAAAASRGEVIAFQDGEVLIYVPDSAWFSQMLSQRESLQRDLGRIAAVRLSGIRFTAGRDTLEAAKRRGSTGQ